MSSRSRSSRVPTPELACDIVQSKLGAEAISARRFWTGTGNWVYEVTSRSGPVVARLSTAEMRQRFDSAVYWSKKLRPLGVPLPRILSSGTYEALPYLVLERLPGTDLGNVYDDLSAEERRAVAKEVCSIQTLVHSLTESDTYGYLGHPTDRGHASWNDVVQASLDRSRRRIAVTKITPLDSVERVESYLPRFQEYFASIRATPFLDDTTTKNVLVSDGALQGIVDVDWVCYGDPLWVLGLTRAAIQCFHRNQDYVEFWREEVGLGGDEYAVLSFYTAIFCVDFLSELGQHFAGKTVSFDSERAEAIGRVLDENLAAIR